MLKKTIYLSVLCASILISTGCSEKIIAKESAQNNETKLESSTSLLPETQKKGIKEINVTNLPSGASQFIYKDNMLFYMERTKGKVEVHIEDLLTGEKIHQ